MNETAVFCKIHQSEHPGGQTMEPNKRQGIHSAHRCIPIAFDDFHDRQNASGACILRTRRLTLSILLLLIIGEPRMSSPLFPLLRFRWLSSFYDILPTAISPLLSLSLVFKYLDRDQHDFNMAGCHPLAKKHLLHLRMVPNTFRLV